LVLLAGALFAPAGAVGQTVPDDSAFDQYLEAVPTPRGEELPRPGHGEPLPPGVRQDLDALGPAGAAAADLAELTSKRTKGDREREADGGIASVLDAIPWGFGLLLIVILAVTALLAAALHAARRRAATPQAGA
jgi:hypothetical protein